MSNGIDKLAESVGKIAPELYEDALKPSAQESGKFMGRILRAINAALAPLDIWILNREYNVEETKKLLAKKLENVPSEKIVPPEPYVAVPALQAISYSMDSEELRDMYANLLAYSMFSDTKDNVHPAFVEIIRQLTPLEAKLLKSIAEDRVTALPTIKLDRSKDEVSNSGINFVKHIIEPKFGINRDNMINYSIAIDNLLRLKIIDADYAIYSLDESLYDSIKNSHLVKSLKDEINSFPNFNYPFIKNGVLNITDLGISFINICI